MPSHLKKWGHVPPCPMESAPLSEDINTGYEKSCKVQFLGQKMVRNALHNAFSNTFTTGTTFPLEMTPCYALPNLGSQFTPVVFLANFQAMRSVPPMEIRTRFIAFCLTSPFSSSSSSSCSPLFKASCLSPSYQFVISNQVRSK